MNIYGEYFYGNKISDYGLEHGFVDYGTLAKAFDAVLNNDIMSKTDAVGLGYWEQVSGFIDHSDAIDELNADIDELNADIDKLQDQANGLYDSGDVSGCDEIENKINDLRDSVRDKEDRINELENEQDEQQEVFQWYIVSDQGANILQEVNEIVYYNEELDVYLWGVTHYGTSWSYVLTNIPCNTGKF